MLIKKAQKKNNDDKKDDTINELTAVLQELGFAVRFEKGSFKGGFCFLREQKMFLVNKSYDQDRKIKILAKNIAQIGIEGIYVKPGLREIIEQENYED